MEGQQFEIQKISIIKKEVQSKSRKTKAQNSKVTKNTRRRKQSNSSDQNLLPSEIPHSSEKQPIVSEGHENQLTKVVIRVPMGFLKLEQKQAYVIVQVQQNSLAIKLSKKQENLNFDIMLKNSKISQIFYQIGENSSQQEQIVKTYNIGGKFVYLSGQEIQNKVIKSVRKIISNYQNSQLLKIKLKQPKSDLFCYLILRSEEYLSEDFNGLINQGNTCYMNSYLQTIFHIPAFRNLVYQSETQDQSKFPATLQDLFFNLTNNEKAVSPQFLVKSFGWGKKQSAVQQDTQQFSCLFFQVLERKLNQSIPVGGYKNMTMHDLFKGELNHYIRCTDVSTQNYEEFIDLQIPVLPTLEQSLNSYTSEVHLAGDNKYSTEEFGLQQAYKGVKISLFPPILMLQLKRFQYNFMEEKNTKILEMMEYEERFDFSKWSLLETAPQIYELYAVLVHQGSKAESGHYYCFIKTAKGWYKFNDQYVQQVSKEKVFNYNFGGYHQSLEFDAKQMKVNRKFIESKSTAYMLVYIKQEMKELLMTDNKQYPEWLLKKDEYKFQLEEFKKTKKNYLYNVKVLNWETNLLNSSCEDVGFLTEQNLQDIEVIEKIPKKLTILEWLENKQFDASQLIKSKKNSKNINQYENSIGIYSYYATPEREILAGYQNKSHHLMEDLLRDSVDPIIFKAPVQAKKNQFLLICKKYKIMQNQNQIQRSFSFDNLFVIQKDITIKKLLNFLEERYQEDNLKFKIQVNKAFKRRYYIEQEKSGLRNISQNQQGLLPVVLPSKNQLLICVVEQICCNLKEKEYYEQSYMKYYQSKKDQITLVVSEEKTKQFWQIKQISVIMTCSELRKYIFNNILKDRQHEYQSTDNIVIRAKQRKGAKILTQISELDIQLKQLIKHENKIQFGYSSLSIGSRLAQQQRTIYYRFQDFSFSQPITVVVDKNQTNQKLVQIFKSELKIKEYLKQQHFNENQAQLFLFSKDKLTINDYVDNEGKVYTKGELQTVLKKQKNALLVIQGIQSQQNQSQQNQSQQNQSQQNQSQQNQSKILNEEEKNDQESEVMILLHHISQTNDKVGIPRSFKVDRKILLHELRNKIFDSLDGEVYEWQGKTFKFNPFKARLLLYASGGKRFIELHDLESMQEIKRLKIEEKIKKDKENTKKTKNRKVSELVQNQIVNEKQFENKGSNENLQCAKQADEIPVSQPETLLDAFPKARSLKIQVIHNELIRPNIALRLNVDG